MYDRQLVEAIERAFPVAHSVTADDVSPGFVVQYVPELGTGATAATAAYDGTDMTFTTAGTTPAGNDAIGTDGVLSLGTYTTIGALQDIVNASRCYRMYLGTCVRADLTATAILTKTATSIIGKNGLTFYIDTSAVVQSAKYGWGFPVSGEKFVSNTATGWLKDWDAQCVNILDYLAFEQSAATGGFLYVYQGRQGVTEEVIWKHTTVDATLKEINASLSKEIGLMSPLGYRLIPRFEGDASTTATIFNGRGRTAVMNGAFAVSEKNY